MVTSKGRRKGQDQENTQLKNNTNVINFNSQGFSMIWFTNEPSLSSTTRRNALKCVSKLVLVVIKTKYTRYQNNGSSKKNQRSNQGPRKPFVTSQIHLTDLHTIQFFFLNCLPQGEILYYIPYMWNLKRNDTN